MTRCNAGTRGRDKMAATNELFRLRVQLDRYRENKLQIRNFAVI